MPLIALGDWSTDTIPGARPVEASACGKVILFGEHSVVYGEPALAVPLRAARMRVRLAGLEGGVGSDSEAAPSTDATETQDALTAVRRRRPGGPRPADPALLASMPTVFSPLSIEVEGQAPESAPRDISRALAAASHGLGLPMPLPLRLRVANTGLASGLGTSAALGVALVRALARWHGEEPVGERCFGAAMAVEALFHGNPSGVDVAVATHEVPLWFVRGTNPLPLSSLPPLQVVLLRRRSTVPTRVLVEGVRARLAEDPALARVIAELGRATRLGRAAWEAVDHGALAAAMRDAQDGLDRLGVVAAGDRETVAAALEAGAVAAKITGAGGGGSVIALPASDDEAQTFATRCGGEVLAL